MWCGCSHCLAVYILSYNYIWCVNAESDEEYPAWPWKSLFLVYAGINSNLFIAVPAKVLVTLFLHFVSVEVTPVITNTPHKIGNISTEMCHNSLVCVTVYKGYSRT